MALKSRITFLCQKNQLGKTSRLTGSKIPEIKWRHRTVDRSNRIDQPLSELRIFAEKASDSLEGNSICTWSNQKLKQMSNHPKNSTAVMQNV